MLKTILLIGSGGFIGSVARFFVSKINLSVAFFSIPVGTLLVNVLGCLIIGFLTGIAEQRTILTAEWRLFLMVGFCGGFTTFSTFANENLMLMHNGLFPSVLLYTGLSILLGFLAVYLGFNLANTIL
jgi:CrcB protein